MTSTDADGELRSVWDVVDGMRVHGRVGGRALGRQVVFVHGLGMSTRYLEPTMRALTGEHAVSALDLPGFGQSRLPGGRVLSLGELASVLESWLRVRGIVSPILVGNSHGCQVIVESVVRRGVAAAGLVLNAPTMEAGHRTSLRQIVRAALDTPREPPALWVEIARAYVRSGPRRILITLADAVRDAIEEKLPAVRVPVVIVSGERDPISPPAWGEQLARLTGGGDGASFRSEPGSAHAIPFTDPEVLAAEIARLAR